MGELPTVFVRPARSGLIVLVPGKPPERLPDSGSYVEKSPYWVRAIRRGDVVVGDPNGTKE